MQNEKILKNVVISVVSPLPLVKFIISLPNLSDFLHIQSKLLLKNMRVGLFLEKILRNTLTFVLNSPNHVCDNNYCTNMYVGMNVRHFKLSCENSQENLKKVSNGKI